MTNPTLVDHADLRRRGLKQHRSTTLRLEGKGQFPKRVKVGAKTYWLAEEIDEYLAQLASDREAGQ